MAAPKQKGLDYSLIKKKIKNETFNILSSSVVYGPNASGKTNIIGAMDSFRTIVLRGNILNQDNSNHPNSASICIKTIFIININELINFRKITKFQCIIPFKEQILIK